MMKRGIKTPNTRIYKVYGYRFTADGWSETEMYLFRAHASGAAEAMKLARHAGCPTYGDEDARSAKVTFEEVSA